jgi:hypothetical protein
MFLGKINKAKGSEGEKCSHREPNWKQGMGWGR